MSVQGIQKETTVLRPAFGNRREESLKRPVSQFDAVEEIRIERRLIVQRRNREEGEFITIATTHTAQSIATKRQTYNRRRGRTNIVNRNLIMALKIADGSIMAHKTFLLQISSLSKCFVAVMALSFLQFVDFTAHSPSKYDGSPVLFASMRPAVAAFSFAYVSSAFTFRD